VRSAALVGFLGGFTTFSSFAVQSFNLLRDGEVFLASANILVSNIVGFILVWVGYAISRAL
jgi:CrcB protein